MAIWKLELTREGFFDMLLRDEVPVHVIPIEGSVKREQPIGPGTIRLMWQQRPKTGIMPALVIAREGDLREFYAWSNTYLPGWRPISSLFRVISEFNLSWDLGDNRGRQVFWEYRNAALGMIFCEALLRTTWGDNRAWAAGRTYVECIGTYSFAMARAMYTGVGDAGTVAEAWRRARMMRSGRSVRARMEGLTEPWSVLLQVSGFRRGRRVWETASLTQLWRFVIHSIARVRSMKGD